MKSLLPLTLLIGLFYMPAAWPAPQCSYGVDTGGGQCIPPDAAGMPSYQNQQQAQPQQPPARWENRWGAIATDFPHHTFGAAINKASKSEAEQAALVACQTNGGQQCKIETWYSNGCAAMVVGDQTHTSNNAATLDKAIQIGMKTCTNGGDTSCKAYYTGCSQPVRVQ